MKTLLSLLLAILFTCLPVVGAEPPLRTAGLLQAATEPVRVVCFGDSITGVYYHTGGRRAYPEMLEAGLRQLHPGAEVRVHNAGVSGNTTGQALARLDRDVLALRPHLVTVMFGMNDVVRTPPAEFYANLRAIVRRCRAAGSEVLLCTQNSVLENPERPNARLAEFTALIRTVAAEETVPLADCHARFEALRRRDPLEWRLLLSETIHPNLDGHRLFAAVIAEALCGRAPDWTRVPAPAPALPRSRQRLAAGQPLRVLAMPPCDRWIAAALQRRFPGVPVQVTAWPVAGQSLAQLEAASRRVRHQPPDLVMLAVPAQAMTGTPEEQHRLYSWILNWSLSFGRQEWDVLALPPSLAQEAAGPVDATAERFARRLIHGKDLATVEPGAGAPESVVIDWLDWNL